MRFTDGFLATFLELGGELCTYTLAHIQLLCSHVHTVLAYRVVGTKHHKTQKLENFKFEAEGVLLIMDRG